MDEDRLDGWLCYLSREVERPHMDWRGLIGELAARKPKDLDVV
jgi:hypothetical protein